MKEVFLFVILPRPATALIFRPATALIFKFYFAVYAQSRTLFQSKVGYVFISFASKTIILPLSIFVHLSTWIQICWDPVCGQI